jgi:hypothetical protein
MVETKTIEVYLKNGYSLIPLKHNQKKPAISWKQYQKNKASFEDVLSWSFTFPDHNVGIVTGQISKLVVVDIDDLAILPKLLKELPELKQTTKVKTTRGFHFYFSTNGNGEIKATKNFLGLGVELFSDGQQVVAPPSKINGVTRTFEKPLEMMLPFPSRLYDKKENKQTAVTSSYHIAPKLPGYNGKNVSCISQILSRALQEGERTNSLFILYNLLLQNRNKREYSQKIIINKNKALTKPLGNKEIANIFKKVYKYNCSGIVSRLPFISCNNCKWKFKKGKLKVGNILVRHINELPKLSNTEAKVVLMLGTYFDGETPSNYAIAKLTGMDKRIVSKAVEGLKKKGII